MYGKRTIYFKNQIPLNSRASPTTIYPSRIHCKTVDLEIFSWRLEPAVKRLDRMAAQAKSLADQLNIENFSVITNDHGVRLEPEAFSDF